MQATYLDYNATAPLLPEAREAMLSAMDEVGNAFSVHATGRAARNIVENAREEVAVSVAVSPDDVIFTSGATEANAMALAATDGGRVLASAIEHDSVLAQWPDAERVGVRPDGTLDIGDLSRRLAEPPRPVLFALMLANNETGAIQPVQEASRLAAEVGVPVHCDTAQAWGKMEFGLDRLGVSSMVLSAHKAGGPKGAGALVLGPGVDYPALIRGGGQERGRRAGTENVPAIAGFGAVAALDRTSMNGVRTLRDRLESKVAAVAPSTVVIAVDAPRLSNTSMLSLPGAESETLVIRLDLEGFAVGAGAACSSGTVGPSHVLAAMNIDPAVASGAIRVSLGTGTTEREVDAFSTAWGRIASETPACRAAA